MTMHRFAAGAMILALSACGGGGNASSLPPIAGGGSKSNASTSKPVKISLVVPNQTSSSALRKRPNYISASALGAAIAVTGAAGGTGSGVVDLSPASTQCAGTGATRSCSVNVTVPIDTDTFTITIYDAAPVGGAIPASAHVLGKGSVTQTITLAFAGAVSILVGGMISNIGLTSTFTSVPADGSTHQVGIAYGPTDFGNNPLGGSNAPFANPITVTLAETAGTTMSLVYNGTPVSGTTATLKNPGDTIAVNYTGVAVAGDTAIVTMSAAGATSQSMSISPMIVSSSSTFYGNYTLSLNGSVTTIQMQVAEAGSPPSPTYTATAASGCTSGTQVAATVSALTGSGNAASFSVTGGAYAEATSCTVAVSDGTSTVTFAVLNTPVTGSVPLPGATITPYAMATPTSLSQPPVSPDAGFVAGPDGRIWADDVNDGYLEAMTTSGASTLYDYDDFYNWALAAGPDGNIWTYQYNSTNISIISPSNGNILNSFSTSASNLQLTAGPDGNMWATQSADVARIARTGAMSTFSLLPVDPSPNPAAITSAPDGTLWFCDDSLTGTTFIWSITTSGVINPTAIATLPGAPTCIGLAAQTDGKAVWATTSATGGLYRIDASTHAVTQPAAITGQPYSVFSIGNNIVAGADKAMYVSENSSVGLVARIPYANPASLTEFPVSGTATGIALGADGRIWFGMNGTGDVGALTP